MEQEELTLVQALRRGERYACNDLVERYSNKIYNVALRLTRHPTEAEECCKKPSSTPAGGWKHLKDVLAWTHGSTGDSAANIRSTYPLPQPSAWLWQALETAGCVNSSDG